MPHMPPVEKPSIQAGVRPRAEQAVYLDCHASTPCDARVVQAMLPFFREVYANPSSSHRSGTEAARVVDAARERVAEALGAAPGEIIFTSGATESNNLAILGAARAAPRHRRRVIASAIEHKAVLGPMRALEREGFQFDLIPVQSDGRVDLEAIAELVRNDTAVVSIQAANNEIGTVQPVAEIAQIVHRVGAVFHCDAAQAVGRIPIDVADWEVDLLSISGHKCYGPKGSGALYVRGGARNAPIQPITFGGGQETELRPGTLDVPGIVGLGRACEIVRSELDVETPRIAELRDTFERILLERIPDLQRNGALDHRLTGNSSLRVPGVDAQALIASLPDVVISTGSACTSGALTPSHVLLAIGLPREHALQTIRVGLGRYTSEADVPYAANRIADAIAQIRTLSA